MALLKALVTAVLGMDSKDEENGSHCVLVNAIDSAAVDISNEQFVQLSSFMYLFWITEY